MKTNMNDDGRYIQLREAWIANEAQIVANNIDEASAHLADVRVKPENVIRNENGGRIVVKIPVKNEQDQDASIEVSIPPEQMRGDRISSKFLSTVITAFNKGNWAKGHRAYSKGQENDPADFPKNKLREVDIRLLNKGEYLPPYSKSIGVRIDPNGDNKKALVTKGSGSPVVVNIENAPHYLVGFEIRDENGPAFRVDGEGQEVIVAVMPVPMNHIRGDGLIDPAYTKEFVNKWNAGQRYVWDGSEGHFENVENPQGSQLSVQELSAKIQDLDRSKPEFKAGEVGDQGVDAQRHRGQASKPLINDSDIEKHEKQVGRELTRKEFIDFVKNKGLITPEAFDKRNPPEKKKAILVKWLTNNPIIASYLKSRKRAMSGFSAGNGAHETPDQIKSRMSQAQDAELMIVDDAIFELAGTRDNIWASDEKAPTNVEEPAKEPSEIEEPVEVDETQKLPENELEII